MKRVLVTGASGFIGRACIEPLLARGFEVHGVCRSDALADGRVHWHDVDLLAEGAARELLARVKPTHVLHLAWYAVPGKYWTSRENTRWVRASLALYEAFVAEGGKRFVGAGTCAEYDWSEGVCNERSTPVAPGTFYATCKDALARVIAADAVAADASFAWARFFFLYGPHEYPQRLISSVILALLRGETARCSPGLQRRDFIHVADAAAATVALLDSAVTGPVNIGSGEAPSVRSIVEQVAALVGGSGQVDFAALPAPQEPPLVVADVGRLRDEVGFMATQHRDERLRETIEWWRRQS